jgi:DNA-binding transcriptional ArsR family regulator
MRKQKNNRLLRDDELESVAQHFRMLGEPMRLKILQAICAEPRPVNDIVAAVQATQANVSKHLALLASAGLVTRKKDGQSVYYGIKDELVLRLCELVRAQILD